MSVSHRHRGGFLCIKCWSSSGDGIEVGATSRNRTHSVLLSTPTQLKCTEIYKSPIVCRRFSSQVREFYELVMWETRRTSVFNKACRCLSNGPHTDTFRRGRNGLGQNILETHKGFTSREGYLGTGKGPRTSSNRPSSRQRFAAGNWKYTFIASGTGTITDQELKIFLQHTNCLAQLNKNTVNNRPEVVHCKWSANLSIIHRRPTGFRTSKTDSDLVIPLANQNIALAH